MCSCSVCVPATSFSVSPARCWALRISFLCSVTEQALGFRPHTHPSEASGEQWIWEHLWIIFNSLQENSCGRPVSDMHISTLVAQWLFLPFGFRTQEFLRGGRNKHSHTAKTWKLFLLEDLQLVPQILCVPEGMVHRHCQKFSTARFCRSRWALKDIYVKILAESAWCKAVRVWGWMVLLRDVHALGFYMHLKSQGAHF